MGKQTVTTVTLSGLTCHACQRLVEKFLRKIEGVHSVEVQLESGRTKILADRIIDSAEIELALENTAYQLEK